jgi:hypothetical protein
MSDEEKRMEAEVNAAKLLADVAEKEAALKRLEIIQQMLNDERNKAAESVQAADNGNSSG